MSSLTPSIPYGNFGAAPLRRGRAKAKEAGLPLSGLIVLIWLAGFVIGFRLSVTCLSVVGLIAVVLGFAKPLLGAYGIAMLSTLDALTRVFVLSGGLLRWNTFNYLLLLACCLSVPMLLRRNELPTRMLAAFIAFLAMNLLFVDNISGGLQHIFGAFAYFGLLVYFVRVSKHEDVWEWVAIVSGLVAALGGLVYFVQEHSLPYINKNAWAFLPLTAMFAACLARTYRSRSRAIATTIWLLVMVNVVWIVLSGSRGAMTIAASCLLYLISGIPGISSRAMIVTAGCLVGLLVASHFAEQTEFVKKRFDKSIDSEYSLSSRTSGRSDLAIAGWRMFLQHSFLGVGTGGYSRAWESLDDRQGMGNYAADRASQAHSAWIKTLAEGGVPGILLMTSYVLSFTVLGRRSGDRTCLYLGLLVTVTLTIAFISTEFQGKGLWFFAAGAAVILVRQSTSNRQQRALRASLAGHHG
jgi:hypothetical protein